MPSRFDALSVQPGRAAPVSLGVNATHTTKAPFLVGNRWRWITWHHTHASKHAAMCAKGAELGATMWDYGQADHGEYGTVRS